MKVKVYDADTGELLDEAHDKGALPPEPGVSWPLPDGVKTVVDSVYVMNPWSGEIFIAVKVR